MVRHSSADPHLITKSEDLAEFCGGLAHAPFITIDTEFLREKTYWPILCLVQIAGPETDQVAAIDTLAPGLDLAPLAALLKDTKIMKVFHAARQDVEIFFRMTGAIPKPIVDTQVLAMVCGFGDAASYETLAGKLANARLDKLARFTDWARRPLSARQLDYALSDVIHLRGIYQKLHDKAEKTGRLDWIDDEMALLTDPATYEFNPENAWKRLKTRSEKPRFLAVLKEVAAWREREAQSRDVPRNRVLNDENIVEIAAHVPETAGSAGAMPRPDARLRRQPQRRSDPGGGAARPRDAGQRGAEAAAAAGHSVGPRAADRSAARAAEAALRRVRGGAEADLQLIRPGAHRRRRPRQGAGPARAGATRCSARKRWR